MDAGNLIFGLDFTSLQLHFTIASYRHTESTASKKGIQICLYRCGCKYVRYINDVSDIPPEKYRMSTPQAQTVRRWVMTGSVAAITATGALYGAGLKTRREHKEVGTVIMLDDDHAD